MSHIIPTVGAALLNSTGRMPTIAIPLVFRDADVPPLGALNVVLPNKGGIGDLPWEMHRVSTEEEERLLGSSDPPAAIWFESGDTDEAIRKEAIPLLAALHLLGSGVAPVLEAWVYENRGGRSRIAEVRLLRLQLLGRGDEFYMRAGINDDLVGTACRKVASAAKRAPWIRVSLEHLLLALDKAGLSEGILDMTICLESLIRATTEIAFRFSHQIPRLVTNSPSEIEDYQALLRDLYEVRSGHVHGAGPSAKSRKRLQHVQSRMDELESIMRDSIRYAIEFHARSGVTKDAWDTHLNQLLHGTAARLAVGREEAL